MADNNINQNLKGCYLILQCIIKLIIDFPVLATHSCQVIYHCFSYLFESELIRKTINYIDVKCIKHIDKLNFIDQITFAEIFHTCRSLGIHITLKIVHRYCSFHNHDMSAISGTVSVV